MNILYVIFLIGVGNNTSQYVHDISFIIDGSPQKFNEFLYTLYCFTIPLGENRI